MTNKLDLSLPERQPASMPSFPRAGIIVNLMILVGVCAILAILLFQTDRGMSAKKSAALSFKT